MKTKGTYLMEYRAKKTKGTSYGFCVLLTVVKEEMSKRG